ncbi:MAG: PspC domain-containing protein [Pseudomonadota bacterium]
MNIAEEVKRLHELHQAGALTDAEFEAAKAKLLASGSSGGAGGAQPGNGDNLASEVNRLRRARDDRWLGGVCGGLAKVSGLESWVWRLIFVAAVCGAGFGVLIYLLMWIFVPEE